MAINTSELRWEPDPTKGLAGDAHLLEAIEEHVDDIGAARQPGIYVLELSTPATTDFDKYARLWLQEFETTPRYLQAIADNDRLLYVGAAADVLARLEEHIERPNRSTTVATVFPIVSIEEIQWFDRQERAFEREKGRAMQLANQTTDAYVHSR